MYIDFDYYKVFCYVAKYGKISEAANKLFVSQPAVTQIMKRLEESLGTTLVIRNRNGIELTEQGRFLYSYVSSSVEILDGVEFKFGRYENLEEGTIMIKTGSNAAKLVLYDAMERFSKDYPNVKIKISSGAPETAIELLRKGEIDMIIVYLPYDVKYSNLKVTEIGKKEYLFVMSKRYHDENNVNINTIEDINNYSLIVPKKESAVREMYNKNFGKIITNYHYEVASEEMKKEFISRDMGIGFVIKDEVEEELKSGEFVSVDIEGTRLEGSIGIVTLNNQFENYATKRLSDYIVRYGGKENNGKRI